MTNMSDEEVREYALKRLEEIRTDKDASFEVRAAAQAALEKLANPTPMTDEELLALVKKMQEELV